MKNIRHRNTLVYYDGVQVFEAEDAIGGNYVAVLADSAEATDRYLVVGVPPESLRRFRVGALDLRYLLLENAQEEWYLASLGESLHEPLNLELQSGLLSETLYVPDEGFILHERASSSETLNEARSRNNLVMEIVVEPPESANSHRIRLTTYTRLLSEIQSLAKHAYKRALRDVAPVLRRNLDTCEGPLLDVVVPALSGSFRVMLEAAQMPDLVGQNELARALQQIDHLFENVGDPRQNLEIVKTNKGHLAGAYIRLLRLLVENSTNLRYSWAEPGSPQLHARSVGYADARDLVRFFSQVSNLDTEEVELVGSLKKVDMLTGSWKLETEDGMLAGKRKNGGPNLAGLETDRRYKFKCLEEIEVSEPGVEERTLYLLEHEPA